jgi:tetratricopeptide (TPR) repeat protein
MVTATLKRGITLHLANRFAEAEAFYREALALDECHPDAWHLLGLASHQQGRHHEAIDLIQRAVALKDDAPEFHNNLGEAMRSLGRCSDAVHRYRRAVALRPAMTEAHNNLGLALRATGERDAAMASFREAVRLNPSFVEAWSNLGAGLFDDGNLREAQAATECALRLKADFVPALVILARIAERQGDLALARQRYESADRLLPKDPSILNGLALVCLALGDLAAAEDHLRQALDRDAARVELFANLAVVLQHQNRFAEAEQTCRRALLLDGQHEKSLVNLSVCLLETGRLDEAAQTAREALDRYPENADGRFSLAFVRLTQGDYREGFDAYEARWRISDPPGPPPATRHAQPLWGGESLDGKTILVQAEQGFGDTLQFVRLCPLLQARGARVVLECQPPLVGLLARFPGVDAVFPQGQALPDFAVHTPLLSLPRLLELEPAAVPATPYLAADEAKARQWQDRLESLPGRRIGIAWSGSTASPHNRRRLLGLDALAPLGQFADLSFVSLQKDDPLAARRLGDTPINDFMPEVRDFDDTAALLQSLDLVITLDSAVAHLAAALGKPVWILVPYVHDWRWAPVNAAAWYPQARLFRQRVPGDWSEAIAELTQALSAWSGQTISAPLAPTAVLPEAAAPSRPLRLNLGCGGRKLEGYLNVDSSAGCQPDLVLDLEQTPWPWADDAAEEIVLIHVLEHLGESTQCFLALMKEMWRVTRPGGKITIVVPHPRHDDFLGDPTHVRAVLPETLVMFDQERNRQWQAQGAANTPLGIYLGIDLAFRSYRYDYDPLWLDRLQRGEISQDALDQAARQYNNVIKQITVVLEARKDQR